MKETLIFLFGMALLLGCKNRQAVKGNQDNVSLMSAEDRLYRPNFHFTPKANWMNDPNGMFYSNGRYHLYYQYYPDGNVWGPMHWGHAISKDFVTWEEQPIAIYPDSLGYIFSGSAVVDTDNTSGFGKNGQGPVVAMYTYHDMAGESAKRIDFQTQAIAYSFDEGQSYIKYDGNPVIGNPGIRDFRDPKMVWDNSSSKWIMVLAAGDKIMFYSSANLKEWQFESEFGQELGAHGGVWECPDLFPLRVEGTGEVKWVLLVSINPGGPNGGSATQYFIGDFDGKTFRLDEKFADQISKDEAIWLDYGRDNYAGVTWSNVPVSDGRRLFIGWMSNWDYARDVPTETWRSAMTIPRELTLRKVDETYLLFSNPVEEFDTFKKTKKMRLNTTIGDEIILVEPSDSDVNKVFIEMNLSNLKEDIYTFVLSNPSGDRLEFGFNNIDHYYFVDRTKSGRTNFSDKFADKVSKANFGKFQERLNLQIVLDKTSLEVFFNYGETVMTEIFFPNQPMETIKMINLNASESKIDKLVISELESKK